MKLLVLTLLMSTAALADDSQVSLKAFPVNTRELSAERSLHGDSLFARDAGCQNGCVLFWPIPKGAKLFEASTLLESDPVCKWIGAGCIVVNYAEDPNKIWLTPTQAGYSQVIIRGQYGGWSRDDDQRTRFFSREISLKGVECSDSFSRCKDQGSHLAKFQSFQDAEKADHHDFDRQLHELDRPLKDEDVRAFVSFVAQHPREAARLTLAYRSSVEHDRGGPSDRTKALDGAITDVALLMLEAFTKMADSSSPFYPYTKDNLVPSGSLLDLDRLYVSLSAIKRWPIIRGMTHSDREQLGQQFLEAEPHAQYSAVGVYLPDSNEILLDYTEPFYDVVYTLYHELWHVAVYHSPRTAEIGKEIQTLLRSPDTDESNQLIRHTLLRFFAEHELLAIDQSSRLYRATGQLARQWGEPALSAQGWHDSYFGSSDEMNLFIPRGMRTASMSYGEFKQSRVPYVGFIIDLKKYHDEEKARNATESAIYNKQYLAVTLPQFLQSRTPFHLAHYKKRYLNDIESFDFNSVRKEFEQRNTAAILPQTVHLTCDEAARLGQALGDQAGYGVPFPFDVDGGWDRCPKPIPAFMGKSGKFEPHCSLPNLRGDR
jgi:hypothetical protein